MRIAVALVALLLAVAASPAQSPAELFPPTTLAYAAVDAPALAGGLAALVKGTPWADSLAAVPDLLDRARDPAADAEARETANLALLTAPEALAELGRTRGAAVGLLGDSAAGRPRYAAVFLTGDSGVAAFALRRLLTADPALRRVTGVDGVAVFQQRAVLSQEPDTFVGPVLPPAAADKPFPPGVDEPTYAAVPGLLAVGSDVEAVRDVLDRFKRGGKPPSLAGVAAFQAVPAPAGTVATVYATPAAILAASDRVRKPGTPDPFGVARFLFDLPRWATVTGHLTLADDRVALTLHADYETLPPLAIALTGPALPAEDQARARRATLSDVALTVPPGAGRAGRWLALADAVAAGRGHLGRKPSRLAADLDRAAKGTAVGELLGTVAGVSVGLGSDGPVAVAHLDGSPAAGRWTQELPRLLAEILGPTGAVSSEATAAGRVFTLQWGDEAARSRLSLGVTPQALYLAADSSRVGLLLKPPAQATALPKSRGVVQLQTALLRLNLLSPPPVATAVNLGEGGVFLVPGVGRGGQVVILDDGPTPPPSSQGGSDTLDLLVRRLAPLPLLGVEAAVAPASPNRVTVTVQLPDAKAALRRLFEMPKPVAPDAPAKDAEEAVAPARR